MAARVMTKTVRPWPEKPGGHTGHKVRAWNKDQVSESHSGPQL